MLRSTFARALVAAVTLAASSLSWAAGNPVLSGLVLQSAAADGSATSYFFSTRGSDGNVNLYVRSDGSFINSGNGSTTELNVPLSNGTYTLDFFSSVDLAAWPYFTVHAFFNGDSTHAGVSVRAAARTGSTIPAFAVNSSPSAYNLNGLPSPAAGTLTFQDGAATVTVSAFYAANPQFASTDLVGRYGIGPDGFNDYSGQIVLQVTGVVPEPGVLGMMLAGLVGLVTVRLRQVRPLVVSHERSHAAA